MRTFEVLCVHTSPATLRLCMPFEQAHEHALHATVWSHSGRFLLSADAAGIVKYWETTLNNVKEVEAHPGPLSPVWFSTGHPVHTHTTPVTR